MGLKIEDLVPVMGMINGKGWAGDMFGVKSKNEDAEAAAAQAAADAEAAQKQQQQQQQANNWVRASQGMKKGGKVAKMAKGGSVSSASRRADGAAQRGKTRGKMV